MKFMQLNAATHLSFLKKLNIFFQLYLFVRFFINMTEIILLIWERFGNGWESYENW